MVVGDEGRASKTSAGWKRLFEELSLAEQLQRDGRAEITADQIADISGREPRLMTKFDTREARPLALKQCTIVATRNGVYQIVAGDGYLDLPKHVPASPFRVRTTRLQTLDTECTSESQVLDLALATGILKDFVGETSLDLTVRGRRRCKRFEFEFDGARGAIALRVEGVQIEVDGGYEGDEAIYVVEAKIGLRDNFLVRQLYYPYRMWLAEKVSKPVVPIFVCYSNRQILLYQFDFSRQDAYHSIALVKSAVYSLDASAQLPPLEEIVKQTGRAQESRTVPFPQADDLRRVIDVVDAVAQGVRTRDGITERNDFASRQAGYYADAARYLELIARDADGSYHLTPIGDAFVRSAHGDRVRRLAELVVSRPTMRALITRLWKGEPSSEIERVLARARPELGGTTVPRRLQTVRRWLAWLETSLG